ncbi:hypothetical protein ACXZ9C_10740 [Streptococcus agalactiae]
MVSSSVWLAWSVWFGVGSAWHRVALLARRWFKFSRWSSSRLVVGRGVSSSW